MGKRSNALLRLKVISAALSEGEVIKPGRYGKEMTCESE